MSPKVTVIISAYQKASYLPQTIQSVLDQTFRDFELLIVDDGSTDNTRQVVEEIAARDSRVHYLYQENQGPSGARNTGVKHAAAEIIALLDGDDAWEPDKLAYQVQMMDQFPTIDLMFTNSKWVNTAEEEIQEESTYFHAYVMREFAMESPPSASDLFRLNQQPNDLAATLFRKNVINLSTVILRRRVFDRVGNFEPSLRGPEDLDYWVRVALAGMQYAYSSRITATYFKNAGSLVQMRNESTQLNLLKYALHAFQAPLYEPLRPMTRDLVRTRYKGLIAFYVQDGQRAKALQAFRDGQKYGLGARAFLLAAFGRAGTLRMYQQVRQRLSRRAS
ncbi:MAG: glycosyltransferase family 2 protein [Anaerolineae bacterium]